MRIFSIKDNGKFEEFSQTHFHVNHEEAVLEKWLESNSDDILEDGKLLIIGRQVTTNLVSDEGLKQVVLPLCVHGKLTCF